MHKLDCNLKSFFPHINKLSRGTICNTSTRNRRYSCSAYDKSLIASSLAGPISGAKLTQNIYSFYTNIICTERHTKLFTAESTVRITLITISNQTFKVLYGKSFTLNEILSHFLHSSKNLKGLFEFLLSFLNEMSQNVENRHERRLKLQEDIPRFSNS